jgi:hypothetical protein
VVNLDEKPESALDPLRVPWHQHGAAVYAETGSSPEDNDVILMARDEVIAAECVALHNRLLDALNP